MISSASEFGIGGTPAGLRRLLAAVPHLFGTVAAGLIAGFVISAEAGAAVAACYLLASYFSVRAARWRWLLPLAGALSSAVFPLIGTAASIAALAWLDQPIDAIGLASCAVVGLAFVVFGSRAVAPLTRIRIGLIGSPSEARRLQAELDRSGGGDFEVAATITPEEWEFSPQDLHGPYLCALSDVGRAIDERDLEVLVVTNEFPRERVDQHLHNQVLTRPVQVLELRQFHEHRFGSIPLAEIDYAWFIQMAGLHHRLGSRIAKRAFDLAVSLPLLIVGAPLAAVAILVIRRDGGPGVFRQERIGRGGKPFTMLKLRTMIEVEDAPGSWASADDERVTRFGSFLRGTHIDEVPQLVNVIKGEMSLVGPRPEQAAYVAELSEHIPFYNQRHVVKPGVTGWAQVRVGYAGSLEGTAFKLCNDLYYVKHQALSLDLIILLETLRTLVADRQFGDVPETRETMLGHGGDRALQSVMRADRGVANAAEPSTVATPDD